ncbi:unnamed protein product [Merluccius merluccius]
MDRCVQRLYLESHNQIKKCLTTAYHVAKTEQPFTQYASLLNLQTTNGVDVGPRYGSDQACRRSASADMLGRARQCILVLKDYKHLLFVALVQDSLHVLSCLSLKLQEDGVTLPSALHAFETALLSLTSMATSPAEFLEHFLEDTEDGQFHSVPLLNFSQESRDRTKKELLDKVHESLLRRFKDVETDEVLKAASNLADPREWPSDKQDLAHYGSDFLHTVTGHFAEVLDRNGCDRKKAKYSEWPAAKVLIKSLPPSQQARAWEDFLLDPERKKTFSNLLMVIEKTFVHIQVLSVE